MKVVGITRGTSKKTEKDFTILHVVGEHDDYTKDNSEGMKAENVYIGKRIDVELDDEVELVYGVGFQGKAVVNGVNVI